MLTVKAKVQNGRLVVNEATNLPEGEEVELVAVMDHDEDHLDQAQRKALHIALAQAKKDIDAGNLIDGDNDLNWQSGLLSTAFEIDGEVNFHEQDF